MQIDYGVVYHGICKNVEEKGETQEGLQTEGVDLGGRRIIKKHSAYVRRKPKKK